MLKSSMTASILLVASVIALPVLAPAHEEGSGERLEARTGLYVTNRTASLYSRPSADAKILRSLRPRTVIEVTDVTDQWLRVRSTRGNPDGYIRHSYADPYRGRGGRRRAFRPGIYRLTSPAVVRAEPSMDSRKIATLRAGTEVRVVGRTGLWYRLESETGRGEPGYIPGIAVQRVRDLAHSEHRH